MDRFVQKLRHFHLAVHFFLRPCIYVQNYDLKGHVWLICSIVLPTSMVLGFGSPMGILIIIAHGWATFNAMISREFQVVGQDQLS